MVYDSGRGIQCENTVRSYSLYDGLSVKEGRGRSGTYDTAGIIYRIVSGSVVPGPLSGARGGVSHWTFFAR